jgi:hypothetical protein
VRIVGAQTSVYVYDAFGSLSAAYSNGAMETPPCHTCYLTYDHLGTTRLLTDPKANVIARHDFLPFGEEIPGDRRQSWAVIGGAAIVIETNVAADGRDRKRRDGSRKDWIKPAAIGRAVGLNRE